MKCNNGNYTPPKPPQHLLIHKAWTFSAFFLSIRAEHAPQRAPKTENVALFVWKGVEKNTRTIVHGQYRHETGHSTNQTNRMYTWANLVPFFSRAGPFKATFEHHSGRRGPIAALKMGGLTLTQRLFGTLGRISNPKPMVIHHNRSFVPGICSVCIRRAAQMSEQRDAQSQRSQSKWAQIDGRNCTVRP